MTENSVILDHRSPITETSLWSKIWNNKGADISQADILAQNDPEKIFLTLKTLDGFDVGGEYLTFQAFKQQYTQIKNELEFNNHSSKHEIKSVFEIGCGSGANLYLS